MVVPDWYQCAPGGQPALLTIANAYSAVLFGVSRSRLGLGSDCHRLLELNYCRFRAVLVWVPAE